MKLQEYIQKVLECFDGAPETEIEFDVLVDSELNVNELGPQRVKFKVRNR